MATGSVNQPATGDQDVDGVLSGKKWNTSQISYNFPTSASYYGSNYDGDNDEPSGFQPVSASFQAMYQDALKQYASVANVTFTEVGAASASNISVARTNTLGANFSYGYNPGSAQRAGDDWFTSDLTELGDSEVIGGSAWRNILRQIGHSVGLKNGETTGGPANTAMTEDHDDEDYAIMSLRRTKGGSTDAEPGNKGNPQSLMIYDIAALQAMYGANYTTQSGNTVYSWNPTTGQESINGVAQTAPGADVIYQTVWDGGGADTYDLSKYTTAVTIDLRPGEASTFSQTQLAVTDGATGAKAGGNVFNALLYHNDTHSLIENAKGGSAADTIEGNQAANLIDGGRGADIMAGYAGNDTYIVDNAGDKVIESAGAANGTDTIESSVSIKLLAANVEKLVLTGSSSLSGTGNTLANTITGNAGANTLDGGLGDDIVTGGAGKDTFFFNTKPSAANLDHIKDFKPVDDTIKLENTGAGLFTKLASGHLHSDAFALIKSSKDTVDPDAHILYDKAHGALYYDPNGGSASGRVEFAIIDDHATLTFQDFLVV